MNKLTREALDVGRKGLIASFVWVSLTTPALAQDAGGASNLEPLAQAILDLLTGNVARIFAAIALVVVGYLYWAGRGSASLLFTVLIGCFFVFSARWIVDQILV